jgi:hypothetical protein
VPWYTDPDDAIEHMHLGPYDGKIMKVTRKDDHPHYYRVVIRQGQKSIFLPKNWCAEVPDPSLNESVEDAFGDVNDFESFAMKMSMKFGSIYPSAQKSF